MSNVMQCCYTRIGKQGAGAGWQTVAASALLTPELQKNYAMLQNQNVSNTTPTGPDRNPLNLYEIAVAGDYLFLTRVQYGLLDELGRTNNMFAHSFIFSVKDGSALKNPNVFLTVRDENFKTDVEAASEIPEELVRFPEFTMEEALAVCGLDKQRYQKLIACVCAQAYANKGKKPLYIQGNWDEKTLRALLYVIYKGIPYSLRRTLTAATAGINMSSRKNLIFSSQNTAADFFVNPLTGSNNILTSRVSTVFDNYGFVNAYARQYESPAMEHFFDLLEERAVKLGDPAAYNPAILKIAYQTLKRPDLGLCSENELSEKIYEALTGYCERSLAMDEYIAEILTEINKNSYLLTDQEEDMLGEVLDGTASENLRAAGEQYNINRLSQMEPDQAAEKLTHLKPAIFRVYSRKLAHISAGGEILERYYTNYYLERPVTFGKLGELYEETLYLAKRDGVIDLIQTEAFQLYEKQIAGGVDAIGAYEAYMRIMKPLLEDEAACEACMQTARETYWEHFEFRKFGIEKEAEYAYFKVPGNEKYALASGTYKLLYEIATGEFTPDLLENISALMSRNRMYFDENGKEVMRGLIDETLKYRRDEVSEEQKMWFNLAVESMDSAVTEQALAMRRKLLESGAEEFPGAYITCQKRLLGDYRDLRTVSRLLNENLIYIAKRLDGNKKYTFLLDTWLVLGKYQYDNPFEILDHVQPRFVEEDAEIVSKESRLLAKEMYREFAEEYVRGGGENGKIVKEWLILTKKQKKKQPINEDIPPVETGVGGLFNKFAAKVGIGGSDKEEDPKKPDKGDKPKKLGGFFGRR